MRMRRLMLGALLVVSGLIGVAPRPAVAVQHADACPPPAPGYAQCFATAAWGSGVEGISPATLKASYGFPSSRTAGAGRSIAIISAFDAPNVEADLAVFNAKFKLPACTTANGCFTKVFARGSAPAVNQGWALESTLDVQWAHAIAPGARIVLIEASSNSFVDLLQAFNVARTSGFKYTTNSWGGPEFASQTIFDPLFQDPSISNFFASGDSGGVGSYPSTHPNVISVGGTRLTIFPNGNRYETGWSGSGGGCSLYYAANPVQAASTQYPQRCNGQRATPDLAALADPETGAATYFSGDLGSGPVGWTTVGGTSLASPVMAARAAITGKVWNAQFVYANARRYFDITFGNNGFAAGPGYDLVTGRGRFQL